MDTATTSSNTKSDFRKAPETKLGDESTINYSANSSSSIIKEEEYSLCAASLSSSSPRTAPWKNNASFPSILQGRSFLRRRSFPMMNLIIWSEDHSDCHDTTHKRRTSIE